MIGICNRCRKLKLSIKKRHRNTSYCDHDLNYLKVCRDCQKEDDEYYQELWDEYYAGIL